MDFSPRTAHDAAADAVAWVDEAAATRAQRFLDRIASDAFPCVGSKAALARGAIRTLELGTLGCPRNDAALLDALQDFAAFIEAQPEGDSTVHSFAAVFAGPGDTDEACFEALLWAQLQRLHDLDRARGHGWAEGVSPDPDDPRFSLSVAGHPFFVIGLHAGASRIARRFESPVLVFNSHRQFDALRADGRYAKMQAATRARDTALQGGINPNLADFGSAPETRQYSGRAVEPDWRCPLHIRTGPLH
ncbi:MAG TPA: guanitoxin biosynthesis heme-dependent pre-guanitoxin N-hydroxylase GntA [Lysobacter sp.]|nr:guanitoxin biosynthesis heme-dependent pre-guanitoxin N-hydroxylase GntA [Lysobacter sp.]